MSDAENSSMSVNSTVQWIVSLAVSIVCCACLFVVLAFYITDQHIAMSSVSLRMDLLQQRQDRFANELDLLRRQPPVAQNNNAAPAAPAAGVVVDKAPEVKAPVPPVAKPLVSEPPEKQ
ncbi:MAG: hypothetical protein PHX43_03215 [Alphaproteobacteria bacterium]|nr:hypothetical protein [Alphaproteobacteria bacterium]